MKTALIIGAIVVLSLGTTFFFASQGTSEPLRDTLPEVALENLDGNALRDYGGSTDYVTDIILIHNNDFRDFKSHFLWNCRRNFRVVAYF